MFLLESASTNFSFVEPPAIAVSQKKHKKHKHKKHKKRKIEHEGENYIGISVDSDLKKTFKVRIRKEEDKRYTLFDISSFNQ